MELSAASAADIALVMGSPDAPRHRQFSTFPVELELGYRIKRETKIGRRGPACAHPRRPCGVAIDHLECRRRISSAAKQRLGQHRLAYGRLRHGMHNAAMGHWLDIATEHVTKRSTFEEVAERQAV
jgi:acyl-CoA dehydrogenase